MMVAKWLPVLLVITRAELRRVMRLVRGMSRWNLLTARLEMMLSCLLSISSIGMCRVTVVRPSCLF